MLSRVFSRTIQQMAKFNFASEVSTKVDKPLVRKEIQQYKNGQIVNRSALVLKKEQDIEQFVINTVRNYFRTLNKQAVNLESSLEDHGLDSLDSIEISMQIEEDLGYTISAETLPVLLKVKHYVNYIKHVEQFKTEMKEAPLG